VTNVEASAAGQVTYLWDASHYDGNLTKAILVRAKAEGIEGFTHKLGEGLSNVDDTAGTALAAARAAGILAIGGYWFVHGNDSPVAEAKRCIAVADQHESWWRTFPGWFWQTDAETSSSGLPSPAYVKTFSDTLASLSGRKVIVYASHGMYGNRLAGLGHPLWNANYPTNRQAGFKSLYPGNSYAGWTKYSGQTPVICQYTSSATIAGRTTCDANAFRGGVDELLNLIGADMPLTSADIAAIWAYKLPGGETARGALQDAALRTGTITNAQLPALTASVAELLSAQATITAAASALAAGPGSVDHAALAAQLTTASETIAAHAETLRSTLAATVDPATGDPGTVDPAVARVPAARAEA
jgi:GH25 family lysozyme M1 (1,4-beta-N-acetylmuramidase)